jgi:hypothetical protein
MRQSTRISAFTSVLTSKSTYSYVDSPKIMRSYLFRSIFENLAGYHSSCIHRAFAINFRHRNHVRLTEPATIANHNTITKRPTTDSFRNKHRYIVISLGSKTIRCDPIIQLGTVGTVLPCPPSPTLPPS